MEWRKTMVTMTATTLFPSYVVQTDEGREIHPATDAALPDRVGIVYKLDRDNQYNGLSFGLVWGLNWDDWIAHE